MRTGATKLVLIKNAFANLVRGGASALIAIALPPFLTRSMEPAAFGAWALVLQLAAYVSFLDFGIQTAVGRYVAHSSERNDKIQRDRIVNTALFALGLSAVLALVGTLILVFFLPNIFRQVPGHLLQQVRIAVILVAGSLAVGLPASVFTGIFLGMQRNAIPAMIIGITKIVSAVLIIVVAWHQGTLVQMGFVVCLLNLLSYLALYLTCTRTWPDITFSRKNITPSTIKELAEYCFSLSIWAIGLLFVTGMDLSIVGYYRFNEVAYYSLAATIVTFLGGFYNAIISPMMPATAVLHARGDHDALSSMVTVATRYGVALLLATGFPLMLGMHLILRFWVGFNYAAHTVQIATLLIAANIIRLSITPYVVAMIGSGEQRLVVLTPLLEGISNLIFSLIAGYYLGAVGVALGTLFGAIVGLISMLLYNIPRTSIRLNASDYFKNSLFRPCLSTIPLLALLALSRMSNLDKSVDNTLRVLVLFICLALLWQFGFTSLERRQLTSKLMRHPS